MPSQHEVSGRTEMSLVVTKELKEKVWRVWVCLQVEVLHSACLRSRLGAAYEALGTSGSEARLRTQLFPWLIDCRSVPSNRFLSAGCVLYFNACTRGAVRSTRRQPRVGSYLSVTKHKAASVRQYPLQCEQYTRARTAYMCTVLPLYF